MKRHNACFDSSASYHEEKEQKHNPHGHAARLDETACLKIAGPVNCINRHYSREKQLAADKGVGQIFSAGSLGFIVTIVSHQRIGGHCQHFIKDKECHQIGRK